MRSRIIGDVATQVDRPLGLVQVTHVFQLQNAATTPVSQLLPLIDSKQRVVVEQEFVDVVFGQARLFESDMNVGRLVCMG